MNLPPVPALETVYAMFRYTKEQAIAQYRKNIADSIESAKKAAASKNGKFRGFTEAQWKLMASRKSEVLLAAGVAV